MNNQEILDNAPEGATHVMGGNCYCIENTEDDYSEDGYDYLTFRNEDTSGRHRSLADIAKIAELEKELSSVVAGLPSEKGQAVRDLEQQAKGVEWVLACRELNLSEGEVHTLMDKCNQLRKQDKAPKEQE